MLNSTKIKNKFRYFTFYKWGAIACFLLSIVFLFVGMSQSATGGSIIDTLKPDFGNLSKEKPVSVVLQEAENIGVEYTAQTGRRSTTTYNYFVIKTHNKKLILETKDKDEVGKGLNINIQDKISAITAENQNNLKTLAIKNNASENTKLSEQELLDIKFVQHYTDSDKLGSDYWGWIAFAVFLVCAVVFSIRYWWDKRNYRIAMEDIKEYSQNISQTSNTNRQESAENNKANWQKNGGNEQDFNFPNTNNSPNNYQNNYQNIPVSTPFYSSNSRYGEPKSGKTTYILLAIFLGIFGVHHFYSHKILFGFLHLTWLVCFIIPFFAMEQLALIFLLSIILLPITFVVSLVQALVKGLSKN